MNHKKKVLLILMVFALNTNLAYSEKLATSISTDSLKQDNDLKISNTLAIPKTTEPQKFQPISTPSQPVSINQVSMPAAPVYGAQSMPAAPFANLQQKKITVPNFEKQLEAMLKEQEIKMKKRMSFMESITNEVSRYGMLMVLILVLLIILYAVHKDRAPKGPHLAQKQEEIPKKNIWDEDF